MNPTLHLSHRELHSEQTLYIICQTSEQQMPARMHFDVGFVAFEYNHMHALEQNI